MTATAKVLLYSDDRTVREQVRLALGKRVAADLPELEVFDTATQAAVIKALDEGSYDLCILDGEAVPAGGMGVAKQLKDEIANCPLILLLVARPQDAWLAAWSGAEAIVGYPLDPVTLPQVVADLLRHAGVAAKA
jgi:DNA-binding response OmpR family regulator